MTDILDRFKNREPVSVPNRDTLNSRSRDTQTSHCLEVKQSTIRLEKGVTERLKDKCDQHNVIRECLIEAMFEVCSGNTEVWANVIAIAQQRNTHRLKVANARRAKSMSTKYGELE